MHKMLCLLLIVIVKGSPTIITATIFIFLFFLIKRCSTCLPVCIHQPHKCHSRAQSLSFHRQTWFFYFPNIGLLYKCRLEILYSFWSWDNYFYREKARGNKTGHTALDKRCTNMSSLNEHIYKWQDHELNICTWFQTYETWHGKLVKYVY